MITGTNIDFVRVEIMRLENAIVFDPAAWEIIFAELRYQGRVAGLADAQCRMQTALANQVPCVAVETEVVE